MMDNLGDCQSQPAASLLAPGQRLSLGRNERGNSGIGSDSIMRLDNGQQLEEFRCRLPSVLARQLRAAAAFDGESPGMWLAPVVEEKLKIYVITKKTN